MLRAILKQKELDPVSGYYLETYYTLLVDAPELQGELVGGGRSENGYRVVELVGIEVMLETTNQ